MIRVRSKIDKYYGINEDNYYDHAGVVEPVNQELICLYADLDRYISKIELNIKERHVLSRLMNGYTVGDIAKEFNRHRKEIYRTFEKICLKIKKENDIAWKYDYMYTSYFRVPWKFKECKMCGEIKPLTDDFFNKNDISDDGFYDVCKKC